MVFQFARLDWQVDESVREAARAELDRAIADVGETGFEIHDTVRNVRRRLKRVRALLKLVRPVLSGYAEQAAALRAIGADVGGLRDAAALIEAADTLAEGAGADLKDDIASLRLEVARHASALDAALPRTAFLSNLRERLIECGHRTGHWSLTRSDPGAVLAGFTRGYARARRGHRAARRSGEDEALHDWRKRVKDHAAHLSLLREVSPALSNIRRSRVKRLAQVLGEHQNVCVLANSIARGSIVASPALAEPLAAERAKLARKALRLGAELFSEPAAVVEARWCAYVDEWKAVTRWADAG